jgi:hypothetical protein
VVRYAKQVVVIVLVVLAMLLAACAPGATPTVPAETVDPLSTGVPEAIGTPEGEAPTAAPGSTDAAPAGAAMEWPQAPEMTIDPAKFYVATLKTDKGDIVIELLADKAPVTVNNFVFLAREGYYDNTTFHRVLEGFMAQGGDPTATTRPPPAAAARATTFRMSFIQT